MKIFLMTEIDITVSLSHWPHSVLWKEFLINGKTKSYFDTILKVSKYALNYKLTNTNKVLKIFITVLYWQKF